MNYKKQNMKYIKLYEEYTSDQELGHPGFLKTREETEVWLDSMGIEDYTIKDDLTVDVDGDVWIDDENLDYIPVQFGVVNGDFSCFDNILKSLKGCPTYVGGGFYCYNNNLISLEHCPIEVDMVFDCDNNNIVSLKGCPTKVGWRFNCSENIIVSEIPKSYNGENNPSWETDDPELITSRFFDKLEGLDGDAKMRALADLKKLEPEFYNSAAFQVYNPDSMLSLMKRSREVTGSLFEL